MEWQKLYSGLLMSPKWMSLGLQAKGLWLDCFLWVGLQETAGHIPAVTVNRMCDQDDNPADLAEQLVAAGLWESRADGWQVHDYDEWQTDIERRKELNKARQTRYRERHNASVTRNETVERNAVTLSELEKIRLDKTRVNSPNGESLANRVSADPLPDDSATQPDADVIGRIFERWRTVTGHALAKRIPSRVRVVRARLREGYTEQDLADAIDGVALDPWPDRRKNNNDDLKYVLRDGTTVEKFAGYVRNRTAVGDLPVNEWHPTEPEGEPVTPEYLASIRPHSVTLLMADLAADAVAAGGADV